MSRKTFYEWDLELTDWTAEGPEVLDHDHSKHCVLPRDMNQKLVLVRDVYEYEELEGRQWAYVDTNGLPDYFDASALGLGNGARVPKRFHAELARTIEAAKRNPV